MSADRDKTLLAKRLDDVFRTSETMKKLASRIRSRGFPLTVRGPKSGFLGYVLSRVVRESIGSILVVTPDERDVTRLQMDLELFGVTPRVLPSYGTRAYASPSENSPVWGERMRALIDLSDEDRSVVIAPVRALIQNTVSPRRSLQKKLSIRRGASIDPSHLSRTLTEMGYWRVPKVSVHGEFAVRGEVIDVFVAGEDTACRIVLDYDDVAEIRRFDPLTQQSIARVASILIYPIRELLWTPSLRQEIGAISGEWEEIRSRKDAFESVLENEDFPDAEWAAAIDEATILDYVLPGTIVVWVDRQRLQAISETVRREYETVYRQEYPFRPLPHPRRVSSDFDELADGVSDRSIWIESLADSRDGESLRFACDPPRSFFGNISFLKEEISSLIHGGNRVTILVDTETQRTRISHLLADYELSMEVGRVSGGFALPEQGEAVIQENEIFGRRKRAPASVKRVESRAIDTFVELEEGDFVVHLNHGIGVFRGIQRMSTGANERDYIRLEYAGEEMVFVPIEQVNLVQRYIGTGGSAPRLDTIGGKSWEKRKGSVKKNVEDLADRLISLYSRRSKVTGYAFPPDTEWQLEFESAFPYEETIDQLRCIAEIKDDMEKPQPMDRLICGDVGYGKTEVALRAAFKAVTSGKQVALLAPTTILVEQHYETILQRFESYPVTVTMMSRFVSKKDQRATLERLHSGEVDIVVGTHRLLQRDVRFRDLGLLVIDEEQRFGVKAKERLKEMKTNVDCLTLTATPIPRTLHMSLLKIRDMSLLTTPPHNRHPIETVIAEFNEETVAEAIRTEISRGGQVFFLHNRVETLENVRRFIEQLVPEAMVETAHGKMSSTELEDIMHRFVHEGFQVLVATTIIENGIDIPNVNTIIIDRADMYGISQLYQLRGRVGRSDRVAHAYLFYPEDRALSELAMKRLRIISDFTDLGSGFKIALKDLEVRGAGNILGSQQSGDILSVGFDLYIRLLDEAIREREESQDDQGDELYLELEYSGFIPDDYIEEAMEKMEVYKKIAAVADQPELDSLVAEVEDRFGPMPEEVLSLLALSEIRILGRRLHVGSMRERRGTMEVEFRRVALISADRVLALIRNSGGSVRLDPNRPNVLLLDTGQVSLREKSEYILGRLSQLL